MRGEALSSFGKFYQFVSSGNVCNVNGMAEYHGSLIRTPVTKFKVVKELNETLILNETEESGTVTLWKRRKSKGERAN